MSRDLGPLVEELEMLLDREKRENKQWQYTVTKLKEEKATLQKTLLDLFSPINVEYAEECQECAIGSSRAWKRAKAVVKEIKNGA